MKWEFLELEKEVEAKDNIISKIKKKEYIVSQERRDTSERWVSERQDKKINLKKNRNEEKKKREGNSCERYFKNIEHMGKRNTWRRRANIVI